MSKRKSDTGAGSSSKKARTNAHASAITLVNDILADPQGFPLDDDDDAVRQSLVDLAQYARALEGAAASGSGSAQKAKRTPEELEEAAEKVRKAAHSGIKKQMTWKPSCKTGSAKWLYDGICPDPEVFGELLGLGGPPKFKQKKFPKEEFERHIGELTASVRYDMLYITGKEVNVRWSDTGEFKFSGTYGKFVYPREE
ncbi:hypothetical protein B0H21DRAFT_776327 [Amylocystis lapponica]|nr:hypothetical protein B0H21DRAFT_776327 [Amylocystis lapponica]